MEKHKFSMTKDNWGMGRKHSENEVIVQFNEEDIILFQNELFDFNKTHNVNLSKSEFLIKIFRDFYADQMRMWRRKNLPKKTIK